jgi:hypothetical protein
MDGHSPPVLPFGGMRIFFAQSRRTYYRSRAVTSADVSRASWRKSTFSNLNGNCVEIGRLLPDRVGLRDTKDNGNGPILVFTEAEWSAFIAGAKEGQFDKP